MDLGLERIELRENDVFFSVNETGIRERKTECSYQESNLRPSDY